MGNVIFVHREENRIAHFDNVNATNPIWILLCKEWWCRFSPFPFHEHYVFIIVAMFVWPTFHLIICMTFWFFMQKTINSSFYAPHVHTIWYIFLYIWRGFFSSCLKPAKTHNFRKKKKIRRAFHWFYFENISLKFIIF